jgi:hypothetical protein
MKVDIGISGAGVEFSETDCVCKVCGGRKDVNALGIDRGGYMGAR